MKLGKFNIVENVTVYAELTDNRLSIYVPKKKSRAFYFGDVYLGRTASKGEVLCVNVNPVSRLHDLQEELQFFLDKGQEKRLQVQFAGSIFRLSKAEAHCLYQDIRAILQVVSGRGKSSIVNNRELHAG